MDQKENVLPVDFDGVFRFTNNRDTEFKAKWNSIEYTFPPLTTSPMIIPGETPENVQQIRKKFAKEWAIEQFYDTDKFKRLNNVAPGGTPALYTDSDLAPFIKMCLEPLPIGQVKAKVLPKDSEENYRKDNKGRNVTKVLEEGDSLMRNSSGPIE